MARKPCIHFEGANYHIYSRGNGGRDIFLNDADRRIFVAALMDLKRRLDFRIHAWCLMTNHIHLLLEVGKVAASRIMQAALGRYAQHFNQKYDTYGHLFQGRPGMLLCQRDSYFLQLLRYIHLNPVEAGMADADSWKWSSHRAYAWGAFDPLVDPTEALRMFAVDPETARAAYRDFAAAGTPGKLDDLPVFEQPLPPEPASEPHDLNALACGFISGGTVTIGQLRGDSRVKKIAALRHEFVLAAWRAGFASVDIARYLDCDRSNIAQIIRRKSDTFVSLSASDPHVS